MAFGSIKVVVIEEFEESKMLSFRQANTNNFINVFCNKASNALICKIESKAKRIDADD